MSFELGCPTLEQENAGLKEKIKKLEIENDDLKQEKFW
jgi:hypothetical protein